MNPIEDFRKMINEKREDLTENAMNQIIALIYRFIEDSFQASFYDKALTCLNEFRDAGVKEDEAGVFNEFLQNLRSKYSVGKHEEFWKKIVKNGVTLITNTETNSSKLTFKDA